MGEVYRARDTRLGRDVAVKILPPGLAGDPDRVRRFEQEARAAGMLNHPNILTLYDIGSHEGSPYLVTELLEGATLRARLAGVRRRSAPKRTGGAPFPMEPFSIRRCLYFQEACHSAGRVVMVNLDTGHS